ncbi:MAG: hypothetical protein EAZ07_00305 [Cytophagales bacterium]|nr:MAG: hypothetical protein EAZ07_00305 [Cytophagales bacterium]
MQKTINTILFALMVSSLLIAVHQSMQHGFAESYWIFMLTFLIMMIYQLRANKLKEKNSTQNGNTPISNKKSKK